MSFDLSAETDLLEQGFQVVLESLGPDAVRMSEGLVSRIGLRPGVGSRWTDQFSALTALYPLLQSEGFADVGLDAARRATVAHLCLMTHAFVEDRQFDGQLEWTQDDVLFSKNMLLEGWSILYSVVQSTDTFRAIARSLMSTYQHSHNLIPGASRDEVLPDDYVTATGSGRAAIGALAPMALACDFESRSLKVKDAFDYVATGLQWADDIEDWSADLDSGDRNFLLATLRLRGVDAYSLPEGPARRIEVGRALVDCGVLDYAIEQARHWVDRAIEEQEALNCPQLADQIRMNFLPLAGAAMRHSRSIGDA